MKTASFEKLLALETKFGIVSRDHIPQEELFEAQRLIAELMIENATNEKRKNQLLDQMPHLFEGS